MPAGHRWKVVFYEDDDGKCPVQEYIFSPGHNEKDIALLINVIQRLKALGPDIQGTKMDKRINNSIRELRKDRHRILYGRCETTYVLLHAFKKKTQKTPQKDIDLAQNRFDIFVNRFY